ncbi:hypothetical protein JCM8097_000041 [Rhodosporidiobolus ruineniae]
MASPLRPGSPAQLSSSPSLAIPQIPPRPSSSPSSSNPTPLATSPRRSPALPPRASPSPASPLSTGGGAASNLARSRAASSSAPPNATTPDHPPLSDQQKADVIRKHLLSADEQLRLAEDRALESGFSSLAAVPGAALSASLASRNAFPQDAVAEEEYPTPYHLEGGDMVAGVYKYVQQQAAAMAGSPSGAGGHGALSPANMGAAGGGATPALRRSKSMDTVGDGLSSRRASHAAGPAAQGDRAAFRAGIDGVLAGEGGEGGEDPVADGFSREEMLQPGGFRRDFVFRRLAERGETPIPGSDASSDAGGGGVATPGASGVSAVESLSAHGAGGRRYPTRSFIDFLSLYGHFGGEDLEEIEEEDEESEEDLEAAVPSERTPLVRSRSAGREGSRGTSKKRYSAADKGQGDATVTQAVMMLLKSFVGTGVLFLGKAFYNGGILFSAITLCFVALISLYSFLLLVETRLVVHGSFGDIGGILYGRYMRWAILASIVLSQIGFVSAYIIFVAENLQAFFRAVTKHHTEVAIPYLIMAQLVIFMPLAMIRNIQKLSGTALVADAFIIIGLCYIFANEISVLAERGVAHVELFNKKDFPLLIGTAVFAFEGIGLIIPVQEAMREPKRLPRVLTGVMFGVMILFAGAGTLAYLTYGDKIQTVVFVNLPQDDKFVNASQFLYSLAILLSTPLQLFPAVRIMENGLFSPHRSGKSSPKVKWEKNAFRALSVAVCATIAWLGANDLDKFVSLIGSIACVPLGLVFPAMLHYKAVAQTRKQRIIDIVLGAFGVACAIFSTIQTLLLIFAPAAAPTGLAH